MHRALFICLASLLSLLDLLWWMSTGETSNVGSLWYFTLPLFFFQISLACYSSQPEMPSNTPLMNWTQSVTLGVNEWVYDSIDQLIKSPLPSTQVCWFWPTLYWAESTVCWRLPTSPTSTCSALFWGRRRSFLSPTRQGACWIASAKMWTQ